MLEMSGEEDLASVPKYVMTRNKSVCYLQKPFHSISLHFIISKNFYYNAEEFEQEYE